MSKQVVKQGVALWGGYDLTGDVNAIALSLGADAIEITSLADLHRNYMPGLRTTAVSVKGFWEAANDKAIWTDMGGTDVLSLALTQSEGGLGYFLKSMPAQYQVGGAIGQELPFSLTGKAAAGQATVRGLIMARQSAIAATGHATNGFQLGAVGAAQALYAALHVTGITGSGVSFTGILESSVDNTFASPTTRVTFTAVTDVTGVQAQYASAAGAITDQWFRFRWTISGTGTFSFTCLAGIL